MDVTIKDKYIIEKQIGEGSFGKIFQARHKLTGEKVAVKINSVSDDNIVLKNEARIYTILSEIKGVPNMRNFGIENGYNFMVIDILGPSLFDLKKTVCKNNKFCLKSILSLGLQMIRRIEHIHDKGFIHRDIKPDNFLFGSEKYPQTLYIIDFGLAKKYCKYQNNKENSEDSQDIEHIVCETGRNITGTERYVSINVHDGLTPSRRDDLESIGYVLVYLLMGKLPWSNKKSEGSDDSNDSDHSDHSDDSDNTRVRNCKQTFSYWMLEKKVPPEFIAYIEYCRN